MKTNRITWFITGFAGLFSYATAFNPSAKRVEKLQKENVEVAANGLEVSSISDQWIKVGAHLQHGVDLVKGE